MVKKILSRRFFLFFFIFTAKPGPTVDIPGDASVLYIFQIIVTDGIFQLIVNLMHLRAILFIICFYIFEMLVTDDIFN